MGINRGERAQLHAQRPFKSLAWLIGTPLKIISGIRFYGDEHPDGEVRIVEDRPNTFLLEMDFIRSIWGLTLPARTIRLLIPKASIVCGDVRLQTVSGRRILPDDVIQYGEAEL